MKRATSKLRLRSDTVRVLSGESLGLVAGGAGRTASGDGCGALPTSNATCISHNYSDCCPPTG